MSLISLPVFSSQRYDDFNACGDNQEARHKLPEFGIRDWNGADLWVLLNRLQPMFNYGFALRLDDLRKPLANDTLVRWSLGRLGTDLLYQDLRLAWSDEIVVNFFTYSL